MTMRKALIGLVVLALLAALPFVFPVPYIRHIFILAFIYAVVAANWDLSLGYGGIFNFAHVAFFSIGVYGYGILTKIAGWSPWVALGAGGVLAVCAAVLVAIPVLRLSGIYIILVTFAFAQLVLQLVVSQSALTGGMMGMVGLPTFQIPGYNLVRDGKLGYYFGALILLVASTGFLRLVVGSRLGLAIRALRDDPDYAAARGISVARQRILTLAASAFFTGVAGAYYAAYLRIASPDAFGVSLLSLLLSILLLGGLASIYGPVVAALGLTFLSEISVDFGPWRHIAIAVVIVAVVRIWPGGLWSALRRIGRRLPS